MREQGRACARGLQLVTRGLLTNTRSYIFARAKHGLLLVLQSITNFSLEVDFPFFVPKKDRKACLDKYIGLKNEAPIAVWYVHTCLTD